MITYLWKCWTYDELRCVTFLLLSTLITLTFFFCRCTFQLYLRVIWFIGQLIRFIIRLMARVLLGWSVFTVFARDFVTSLSSLWKHSSFICWKMIRICSLYLQKSLWVYFFVEEECSNLTRTFTLITTREVEQEKWNLRKKGLKLRCEFQPTAEN